MIEMVITMAGLGSRFREKGYDKPKYMLEAKGKSLFEWSMLSLEDFRPHIGGYIFIVLNDLIENAENFIKNQCKKLKIENYKIIVIDKLTRGQAATAMVSEPFWTDENELLVYNIDTYVEPYEMKYKDIKGDGFIPCFQAEGNHWSFVKLDDKGEVIEIKEKERISDYCTLGAYYFKTCKLYRDLYNECYGKTNNSEEEYIAPLYNYLIKKHGKIYISNINPKKVHVLGTPEELENFLNE